MSARVPTIVGMVVLFFFFSSSVFASNLLTNFDFESDTINPWEKSGGSATATISSELLHGGTRSLKVTHSNIGSYGFQQTIPSLEGGMFYQVIGYGATKDVNVDTYFLRVAWYTSADGSGSQLSSPNDTTKANRLDGEWTQFNQILQAPATANSAKVRLVLTSKSADVLASVFFDDITFQESVAPTPEPTPTPTNTPVPTPTHTPVPTVTPIPTGTPTRKPTPSLTSTLRPTPEFIPTMASSSTESVLGVQDSKTSNTKPYIIALLFISVGCALLAAVFVVRNHLYLKK